MNPPKPASAKGARSSQPSGRHNQAEAGEERDAVEAGRKAPCPTCSCSAEKNVQPAEASRQHAHPPFYQPWYPMPDQAHDAMLLPQQSQKRPREQDPVQDDAYWGAHPSQRPQGGWVYVGGGGVDPWTMPPMPPAYSWPHPPPPMQQWYQPHPAQMQQWAGMHPNPESVPPPTFYGGKEGAENGKSKDNDNDKDKSDDKDQSDNVSKSPELAAVMKAKSEWKSRGPRTVRQLFEIVETFEHLCSTFGSVLTKKDLQKRTGLTSSIWEWAKQVRELSQCDYPKWEEPSKELEAMRKEGWKWKSHTHYFFSKTKSGPHLVSGGCCSPPVPRVRSTAGEVPDASTTNASSSPGSNAAPSTHPPLARKSDVGSTKGDSTVSEKEDVTATAEANRVESPVGKGVPKLTEASSATEKIDSGYSESRREHETRAQNIIGQFLCEGGYVDTRLMTNAATRQEEQSIVYVLTSIIFSGAVEDVDTCSKIIARGFPEELVDAGIEFAKIPLNKEQMARLSELKKGGNHFLKDIKTWNKDTGRVWHSS